MNKMQYRYCLIFILLVFWGCKKPKDVDETPNRSLRIEGTTIIVPHSPAPNPKALELWGFAMPAEETTKFMHQISTNQYGFRAAKGQEMHEYKQLWGRFYRQFLVVAHGQSDYHGGAIEFDVHSGVAAANQLPLRLRKLEYIFDHDNNLPIGSGVVELLNAKIENAYQVIWVLVTHGEEDEADVSVITLLNQAEEVLALSMYQITERLESMAITDTITTQRIVRSS